MGNDKSSVHIDSEQGSFRKVFDLIYLLGFFYNLPRTGNS